MLLLDTHQIKRRQKSRPHAAKDKSFYNMCQNYLNGPAFFYNIINKNSCDFCVLFVVVDSQSKHLASASEPFTNHRLERIRLLLYGQAVSASISGAASVLPLCPLKINTSSMTESDLIKRKKKKNK